MSRSESGLYYCYSFSVTTYSSHCCLHIPFAMRIISFFHYEVNYISVNLKFGLGYWIIFCFIFLNKGHREKLKKWVSFEFTFSCCSWKILLPLLSEVPDNLLDDERQMAQNFPLPQITAKQLPEGDPQINE